MKGVDGPQAVSIVAGQILRFEFPAEAGNSLSAVVSDIRLDGPGPFSLRLLAPDGQSRSWQMVRGGETSASMQINAAATGTHSLVLDAGFSALSATVTVKR